MFFLAMLTGFFGAALFPMQIGFFTLFPYRFFLLLVLLLFCFKSMFKGTIALHQNSIKNYIYFLFFWLGYSTISLAWAISKGDAIRDIIFLLMGILVIFFATYYFFTEKDLINLYHIWLFVFCLLIVIGFWEHLTGIHLPVSSLYSEVRPYLMHIPTGVFFNPNDYAIFLALGIPFSLTLFRYSKKKYLYFLSICCFISAFYLIISTGSRANIVAVLFEILFIFIFLMNINKKAKFLIGLTTIIIIFSVIFPLESAYQVYNKIMAELNSLMIQLRLREGSIGIRVNLLKNCLYFLYSSAGFGIGAGNAEYYIANYSKYYTSGIINPHNWWLEILVNYGLIIFLGYIFFYIGIIKRLWKIYRSIHSKVDKKICETLLISMLGFFFASVSSSSIMAFNPQWLLFAFTLSFINYFHRKEKVELL